MSWKSQKYLTGFEVLDAKVSSFYTATGAKKHLKVSLPIIAVMWQLEKKILNVQKYGRLKHPPFHCER